MHQGRIITGACWVVVGGLLLPAIFGGSEDGWGKFIFEYQTLLAGILAVFAAAVAVSQSAATDAKQERRHQQQLEATQGQLDEQRKQTSFMLGDAAPTLEMNEMSGKSQSGMLMLVNWNRQILGFQELEIRSTLLLPRVTWIHCEYLGPEGPREVTSVRVDRNGVLQCGLRLGGYVNRSLAPNRYHISFEFAGSTFDEGTYDAEVDEVCEIVLRCRYGGSLHDSFDVSAIVPYWNFFPSPRAFFER